VLVEQDVRRLHVPVDHLEPVDEVERLRELREPVEHLARGLPALDLRSEAVVEAAARQILQDEVGHVSRLSDVEHRDDVRVAEPDEAPGFPGEALAEPRLAQEPGVGHLDDDGPPDVLVRREEDGPHAALTQLLLHPVAVLEERPDPGPAEPLVHPLLPLRRRQSSANETSLSIFPSRVKWKKVPAFIMPCCSSSSS
jgi:hypothetical protein